MQEITTIAAQRRERAGKGAARATRRDGSIPGVVYGDKQEPSIISLDPRMIEREMGRAGFFARIYDLDVGGEKQRVLARDVQLHPVTDRPLHIDFLRVGAHTRIRVFVPVNFIGQDRSPGLKKGGVLNIVRHEIELYCAADGIPDILTVDLSGTEIHDSIHISHVTLPEGARPVIVDRDFTIASVAAPTVAVAEEPAAAAAAPAAAAKAAPAAKAPAKKK
ncbi:LSU ribosomal protein L25P [Stella humosa]|uniref:Large ribosomal subunit protein bL25 n=1 Tax=Stella humosa TaxID=94 RepID=A0A3N1KRT8_9PROT|nr:50S ribosomal protein L25/general stress protein Ctc [Stella humosa]ROP84623.1 LSU ribosomal protein L25P [Stella humosa]BBK34143.1 50S ribosomal protein L25 [Stella humosa]